MNCDKLRSKRMEKCW